MPRPISTNKAPPSFSAYAQGVEVSAGARTVHVSGQVGARPDGTIETSAEAQHRQAWANVFAILGAAGMEPTDIVDVWAMVSDREGVGVFRKVRDEVFSGHLACSTLLVCGLASPDWKVEIAARAARKD